jgi:hypothetical protein
MPIIRARALPSAYLLFITNWHRRSILRYISGFGGFGGLNVRQKLVELGWRISVFAVCNEPNTEV